MSNQNLRNNLQENEKQLFISWSGETGQVIADLICEWLDKIYSNAYEMIFFSPNIEVGSLGIDDIMKALNKCKKGIFIITRERLNSPWLHFEAGAISKGDTGNSIIPLYVDIKREEVTHDPLSHFQSNYSFCFEDIKSLLLEIGNGLGWNQKNTEKTFKSFSMLENDVDHLLSQMMPDPIFFLLHQICSGNSDFIFNENSSCLAHLEENSFYSIRSEVVKHAKGELIIAGSSLTEAIGYGDTNNRSLRGIIKKGIKEKRITSIKFLLTDISMFETYFTENNEAISRVMGSLNALKKEFFEICDENKCNISVYFLPLHNVEHVVLTNKYMLYRSTKLWTSNAEYKGEFILYQNIKTQSEYSIELKYLKKLMELCTKINFDIDTVKNSKDTYITKEIKEWRRSIKQNGVYTPHSKYPGELEYIHLYKLYYSQLTHYIACDWNGPNHSELRFYPSKNISNSEYLFNSNNLLNDDTQKFLLNYIKETETLLRGVVKKYSNASVNGEMLSDARIFPSLDLGFPNNLVRLAGGFPTGMLVTWKCGTPIVPVDATVNVCSSSVFELPENYDMNQTDETFFNNIEKIIQKASKAGYAFDFASGNHFLMIAEDENNKKYLVLHSSAKEFKDSYIGLYPVEGNWYYEKIRTYPTPYVHGERYIRYIKGDDALFFISLAKKLEEMNVQIHKFFADSMYAKKCTFLERSTYHHYYMPTDSSIAIGTFVEEPGTTVPIFSAPGKEICLFKINTENNWTIQLGGKQKCLIPHGWGQEICGNINSSVDYVDKKFTLSVDGKKYVHDLQREKSIYCPEKNLRQLISCRNFLENQHYINGKIVKILIPKYSYCYSTVRK